MDSYRKEDVIASMKDLYSDKTEEFKRKEKITDLKSGTGLLIFQDIAKSSKKSFLKE